MKIEEIPFSSPQPTGAIFSQFYVALQQCFEMKKDESIFIEIDGDVSLISSEALASTQFEVKEFFDPLTDSDLNFWKTLKNWLDDSFNQKNYKKLLLVTTQNIGVESKFLVWNNETIEGRLKIINDIYTNAQLRFEKSKVTAKEKGNKEPLSPAPLSLMHRIISKDKEVKLLEVIGKLEIVDSHTRRDNIASEIIERELKAVPEVNKQKALNNLLGFIINKEEYNKGWKITEKSFREAVEDIVRSNVEGTTVFPNNPNFRNVSEDERNKVEKYTFVKKIEDIEYTDVITTSVSDYWFTFKTISDEFSERKSKKESLGLYQDELKSIHQPEYRTASRNCSQQNLINKSKDFFDLIMARDSPNLDLFNSTPLIFKNGMYHILANEDEHNINWKLTPKDE